MKWLLGILLLGAPLGSGGDVLGVRFPRLATPLAQVVFVVVAALAIAAIIWCYRREAAYVPAKRKRLLAGLRIGALAVLLFICTGAFLELARRDDAKGRIMLLVDASRSMTIVDRRTDAADVTAAQIVLGSGGDAAKATRADLARAAFANADLDLVAKLGEGYAVEAFSFGQGQTLAPLELAPGDAAGGRLAKLAGTNEAATQLGAALADAQRRAKGRILDAVVVITDGGWNRGDDPVAVAKSLGVPVHTVGVGLAQSRDLEVAFVFCEDVVFKNDRVAFEVRLRSRGYNGRGATLQIKRVDERQIEEVIKEEPVELGEGGELVRTVELVPDKEGVFTFIAELVPFADEPNVLNNRRAKANVRVVDRKIRVLLMDDAPRWEFRFLRGILEADRQRIAPTFILRQGDESAAGGKFLKQFPATAAELRKYDTVILGDIPPDFFTPEEIRTLEAWVRIEGGGLAVIAGRKSMPGAFVGTPLETMLPVECEPHLPATVADELARTVAKGFRPKLTPDAARLPLLRFAADPSENERLWSEVEPLFWFQPVKRLKPGATAFLVHPERLLADGSPMPLLTGQRYGKGQVLFSATDETWRWRFRPGAAQHRRLWGQVVASLSMAHLLGASSRTQLEVDRGEYGIGERARLVARVLDQDYNPFPADSVTVTVERELTRETVLLAARKDQPGTFSGEWIPVAEGRHRLSLPGTGGDDPGDERMVDVVPSRLELDDAGMRQDLLEQIAQVSGGSYVPLERLPTLAEALAAKGREGDLRREERSLWNAPFVILLLVLCLGLEWFLRKRSDLL